MKAEVVVDHDKDRKLQQHADEILKLIKDIKMKVCLHFDRELID
jgi:dynactin 1